MTEYKVRPVLDFEVSLGECPMWSVEDECLYWIDIELKTINRFRPAAGDNKSWPVPTTPGSYALRDDNGAVIAGRDGIYEFDFGAGAAKQLVPAPFDSSRERFNDGRTDRQGRFWAGTVPVPRNATDTAIREDVECALYRFDGRNLDRVLPISIANGLAFSPDGRTMYRAESFQERIFAYDYDPVAGMPSRERVFAEVPASQGIPDGATVDTEGGYWVALPNMAGLGHVARYHVDGRLDFQFEVPVMMSTMVAFGGPDLSTLYITCAHLGQFIKNPVPEARGALFAVETQFRGVPETKFKVPGR
jgi:L-arabinonolactonase